MGLSRGIANFCFIGKISVLWWLMFGHDLVVDKSNFELENVSFTCLQRISAFVAKFPVLGFIFCSFMWLHLKDIVVLIQGV